MECPGNIGSSLLKLALRLDNVERLGYMSSWRASKCLLNRCTFEGIRGSTLVCLMVTAPKWRLSTFPECLQGVVPTRYWRAKA